MARRAKFMGSSNEWRVLRVLLADQSAPLKVLSVCVNNSTSCSCQAVMRAYCVMLHTSTPTHDARPDAVCLACVHTSHMHTHTHIIIINKQNNQTCAGRHSLLPQRSARAHTFVINVRAYEASTHALTHSLAFAFGTINCAHRTPANINP